MLLAYAGASTHVSHSREHSAACICSLFGHFSIRAHQDLLHVLKQEDFLGHFVGLKGLLGDQCDLPQIPALDHLNDHAVLEETASAKQLYTAFHLLVALEDVHVLVVVDERF